LDRSSEPMLLSCIISPSCWKRANKLNIVHKIYIQYTYNLHSVQYVQYNIHTIYIVYNVHTWSYMRNQTWRTIDTCWWFYFLDNLEHFSEISKLCIAVNEKRVANCC
jgi:hypothetical protein